MPQLLSLIRHTFRAACVRPLLFCSDPKLTSFAYPAPLSFSRHCYPRSAPTLRERAPGSEEIRPDPSPFAYSAPQLSAACFREVDGSGRRRVAADIKGNGYRGARGKGCSGRTAGVCLSAGATSPARVSRTNPFPRPRPPFPAMEPTLFVCRVFTSTRDKKREM